jgi:hypothetical protein
LEVAGWQRGRVDGQVGHWEVAGWQLRGRADGQVGRLEVAGWQMGQADGKVGR